MVPDHDHASRELSFAAAINEAIRIALDADPSVFVIGLGAPDPKGVFGTTSGLVETFGSDRILDMPVSENATTGLVLGAAIDGMRPIMTHQRIDFALHAMEQIVNQAAKWHYMFDGQMQAPIVIRMVVGRGWGQGPQHSQSLHNWFAHVPGLKVVMPSLPADAKGLMLAAIADDNPTIFVEHRWLYDIAGPVAEGHVETPLGPAKVVREGQDISIVASSFMTIEALRAAATLSGGDVSAEVIDVHTLNPFQPEAIFASVEKTGHLVVADCGWGHCGFAGEVVARVAEQAHGSLRAAPRRIALPDCPTPTSPALTDGFYPESKNIVQCVAETLGIPESRFEFPPGRRTPHDVPDNEFAGPF